jgi:hypothetical protein
MTSKTIVLAAVAITDKIEVIKQKIDLCKKWWKEGEQNEDDQKFWTQHIESLEKDVLDYTKAKQELMHS